MDRVPTRRRIKEWKTVRKHRFRAERRLERLKAEHDRLVEREGLLEERICEELKRDGPLQIDHQVYSYRVEEEFGDMCLRIDVRLTDQAAGRVSASEVA